MQIMFEVCLGLPQSTHLLWAVIGRQHAIGYEFVQDILMINKGDGMGQEGRD